MKREKREKLTDALSNGTPLFSGSRVPFVEAYPTVRRLTMKVEELDSGNHPPIREWNFTESSAPRAINCSNDLCYGGGIDLGMLLQRIVTHRETNGTEKELCSGYEGSPKGRRMYKPCHLMYKVHFVIDYRDESTEPDPEAD